MVKLYDNLETAPVSVKTLFDKMKRQIPDLVFVRAAMGDRVEQKEVYLTLFNLNQEKRDAPFFEGEALSYAYVGISCDTSLVKTSPPVGDFYFADDPAEQIEALNQEVARLKEELEDWKNLEETRREAITCWEQNSKDQMACIKELEPYKAKYTDLVQKVMEAVSSDMFHDQMIYELLPMETVIRFKVRRNVALEDYEKDFILKKLGE